MTMIGIRFSGRAILACAVICLAAHRSRGQENKPVPAKNTSRLQSAATREEKEQMSIIPAATVTMGIERNEIAHFQKIFGVDGPELFEAEMPRHTAKIRSFAIDKRLATNAEFYRFVERNERWNPERIPRGLHNGNYLVHWKAGAYLPADANRPVVNVSWYAAVAYCQWEGKRLPTESEWEYAARGGLARPLFPWGDEAADKTRANFSESGLGATSEAEKYPANGYGLFDMAGNAWEFTSDEWGPYSVARIEGQAEGRTLFDRGEAYLGITTRRVIRGGSWGGAPINLWVEYRDSHPPDGAKDFVGFRCAKSR